MGVIMKNGISYGGGSGGSGTVADTSHIELTFAEYKELEKQGKVDSKATYFITDEDMNGNNNVDNLVELTQAKYDELGDVVNSDNKTYYITDSEEELDASMITFDDTETQMGVSDVQGAISKLNSNIEQVFQFGSNRKQQVVAALPDSLGLTINNSWEDIILKLNNLFPTEFNLLTGFSSSNWTVSKTGSYANHSITTSKINMSNGQMTNNNGYTMLTSSDIDATALNRLIVTYTGSLTGTTTNISNRLGCIKITVAHSGGNIVTNLLTGTNTVSIDISNVVGNAQVILYTSCGYSGESNFYGTSLEITQLYMTSQT